MRKLSSSRKTLKKSLRPSSAKHSGSTDNRDKRLVARARNAAGRAYAPYSGYRVGAAFETGSGWFVTGCNVENVSYGLTSCAERSAVFALIQEGVPVKSVKRLCVSARGGRYPVPCGACRQVLAEFFDDLEIVLDRGAVTTRTVRLQNLLPDTFRLGKMKR